MKNISHCGTLVVSLSDASHLLRCKTTALLLMLLVLSTSATAQDDFVTVDGRGGTFPYITLTINGNQQVFRRGLLTNTTRRAGEYRLTINVLQNDWFRRYFDPIAFTQDISLRIDSIVVAFSTNNGQSWSFIRGIGGIGSSGTYVVSFNLPSNSQLFVGAFIGDIPIGFGNLILETGNVRVQFLSDGAPAAPTLNSVVATLPDQFGYRYPNLIWTNPTNDAGQLTNVKIYRRRVQGNTVIQNWSLRATLTPSGASQTQSWTDNTISTAQLGNDGVAEYRITVDDNSTPPNTSPNSNALEISYSNNMFSLTERTFSLSQNYPNPFNPNTTIDFSLPERAMVSLKVYDMLGREVATLLDEMKDAGAHQVRFNAGTLSSGVYYYTLRYGSVSQTKKMILAK